MKNGVLTRIGVALGAAVLMLGLTPTGASAEAAKASTTASDTVAIKQSGPSINGATWDVRCYDWGCENFYTITAPTNRAQFWVFCNGWGWVSAPVAFGPGSFHSWVNCGAYTPPLNWQFNWWVA